ncbi:hypothetical protein EXN24_10570 [Rhizobium rhizogenes]|uniref:Uncharacterized protein n=2 Tax=Rhizobium/Agrobacterium group TaxID=227290 RepID=A0AB36EQ14_AGRTU|nr:hypothetical protein AGROH133_03608 [Agrobacterium tumefaciens]QDG92134.1 hypothetical protein NIBR502774_06165 [Rhizobium sp. NIBRBAC000502774]TRA91869.1 hypothetical protein EXN24_10570 [Rhizobium rhizogenes]HCV71547.1 hypothetical protein [Agrobacterium sp.]KAA3508166.1 hypothetical protein DXM26_01590 [Agrobacterium tumefaciens]
MGSWHNFSHHNIYQCRLKKEFQNLPIVRSECARSARERSRFHGASAKGEARKPLRQLTLLGLCPYKPRTLGH